MELITQTSNKSISKWSSSDCLFCYLPPELLEIITSNLTLREVMKLSQTCKFFQRLMERNERLWIRAFVNTVPLEYATSLDFSKNLSLVQMRYKIIETALEFQEHQIEEELNQPHKMYLNEEEIKYRISQIVT